MKKKVILIVVLAFAIGQPLLSEEAKIKIQKGLSETSNLEEKKEELTETLPDSVWLESENMRIRDRQFSQFRNIFGFFYPGIELAQIDNAMYLRGYDEKTDTGTKNGIGASYGFGFAILAEIKNRWIQANEVGAEKSWMRLGSLSLFSVQFETRRGNSEGNAIQYKKQSFWLQQFLYYYFPPDLLRTGSTVVLKNMDFFAGPGLGLKNTIHHESEDQVAGISFPAQKETDFYLGLIIGIHYSLTMNYKILYTMNFLYNLSPGSSNPLTGNPVRETHPMSFQFTLGFGVRL